MTWLDNPAIQGGVAPLVVGLVLAFALGAMQRDQRSALVWLAVVVAYVATTWLATGLAFSPLTASRKVVIIAVAAPLAGLALDLAGLRSPRVSTVMVVVCAIAAVWAFWSIVSQREGAAAIALAAGIALFVALALLVMLRIGDDGMRMAAAGVGLGVATGVSAVLSASIGFLLSGMAIGAACGALLIAQVLARRRMSAGLVAALAVGLPCALFAVGAMLLAQMPWFVLPLLLLPPLVIGVVAAPDLRPLARAAMLVALALVLAILPIVAAWFAARASST
jgi:hypothetical protein